MQKNKLTPNYEFKSLVLFGYIKRYCGINLKQKTPHDVIDTMILWFNLTDSFDPSQSHSQSIHEYIIINDILHECFMIQEKPSHTRYRSPSSYQSSFGSVIVKQGMRYKWRFRSFRKNSYVCGVAYIGIVDITAFDKLVKKNQDIEKFWVPPYNGYAVDPYNKSKYHGDLYNNGRQMRIKDWKTCDGYPRSNYMKYVTMILDMSYGLKQAVLSFEVEDKDGNVVTNIVWNDIDINKKYRMAACNIRSDRVLGLQKY